MQITITIDDFDVDDAPDEPLALFVACDPCTLDADEQILEIHPFGSAITGHSIPELLHQLAEAWQRGRVQLDGTPVPRDISELASSPDFVIGDRSRM